MKIRKAERKPLEDLLSQEADMDSMVEAVFATATDLALERDWYMTGVFDTDADQYYWYGPYESEAQARRAMEKLVSPGPSLLVYSIRRLYKINEA